MRYILQVGAYSREIGSIVYACYFILEVLDSEWMTLICNGMIALVH